MRACSPRSQPRPGPSAAARRGSVQGPRRARPRGRGAGPEGGGRGGDTGTPRDAAAPPGAGEGAAGGSRPFLPGEPPPPAPRPKDVGTPFRSAAAGRQVPGPAGAGAGRRVPPARAAPPLLPPLRPRPGCASPGAPPAAPRSLLSLRAMPRGGEPGQPGAGGPALGLLLGPAPRCLGRGGGGGGRGPGASAAAGAGLGVAAGRAAEPGLRSRAVALGVSSREGRTGPTADGNREPPAPPGAVCVLWAAPSPLGDSPGLSSPLPGCRTFCNTKLLNPEQT